MLKPPQRTTAKFPRLTLLLLSGMLLGGRAFAIEQFSTEDAAGKHCPAGNVVWLNTSSGNIHHKGTKWYGHSRKGAYICQDNQPTPQTSSGNKRSVYKWAALAKINAFNGGATLYINLPSIQRHGNNVEMSVLMDFSNTQEAANIKFLSSEFRKEYDCQNGKWRILSSSVFDKNMGEGQIVQSDNEPDDWKQTDPESIAKTELARACSRPK